MNQSVKRLGLIGVNILLCFRLFSVLLLFRLQRAVTYIQKYDYFNLTLKTMHQTLGGKLVSCTTEMSSAFNPNPLNQRDAQEQKDRIILPCQLRDSSQQTFSYWPNALTARLP